MSFDTKNYIDELPPALIYIPFITVQDGKKLSLPKFHFMICDAINNMTEARKLERLRLSCRTDGNFKMSDDKQYKLEVCGYCLNKFANFINKSYSYIVSEYGKGQNFNIAKLFHYLETTGQRFINSEVWNNLKMGVIIDNNYPEHWQEISEVMKAVRRYKCERCGAYLIDQQKLLHVHHINGVKSDINPKNLINLCAICHNSIHNFIVTELSHDEIIYILNHTHKAMAIERKTQNLQDN